MTDETNFIIKGSELNEVVRSLKLYLPQTASVLDTLVRSRATSLTHDDRGWEQGFQDGQTSALTDLNLLEAKIRNEVLEEMIKLSMMIEENETDRWNNIGRPKNDGYINGSHSGYGHALRDMRQWIDRIKMANGRDVSLL